MMIELKIDSPFVYRIDEVRFSKNLYHAYYYDIIRKIIRGSTIVGEVTEEGDIIKYDYKNLCELIDISKSALYRFLSEAIELGYLDKSKSGEYRVNPSYTLSDVFPSKDEIEYWCNKSDRCKAFFNTYSAEDFE